LSLYIGVEYYSNSQILHDSLHIHLCGELLLSGYAHGQIEGLL